MIKTVVTEAIISKGYEGADAIKIIQGEKGDIARFRIGTKVYDPKADGNSRWFNLSVKAFNSVCERIKKMQLKDGAYINLSGRLDEENWEDPNTHEKKKAIVLIADEVEYLESHPEINMDYRRIQVKIKPDISWAELEEKIRSIIDEKISVAQASGGLENTGSQPIIADADIDEMLHNLDLFD